MTSPTQWKLLREQERCMQENYLTLPSFCIQVLHILTNFFSLRGGIASPYRCKPICHRENNPSRFSWAMWVGRMESDLWHNHVPQKRLLWVKIIAWGQKNQRLQVTQTHLPSLDFSFLRSEDWTMKNWSPFISRIIHFILTGFYFTLFFVNQTPYLWPNYKSNPGGHTTQLYFLYGKISLSMQCVGLICLNTGIPVGCI